MTRSRILIIEDETFIALALEDTLTAWGYEVVGPAARIRQALRLIETESFAAAVMDINLAGETVTPAADALMARGIPFVLTSGYDSIDMIPERLRNQTFLRKPYTPVELRGALAALLNGVEAA